MSSHKIAVAIPVYDGVDLMDIAGPREVFSWAKNHRQAFETSFVGERNAETRQTRPITTRCGLTLLPDRAYDDFGKGKAAAPDLIWIPGGEPDALRRMLDEMAQQGSAAFELFRFIKAFTHDEMLLASVCEGAILLAETGLLDGYEITTHHSFYPCMAAYPEVKLVSDDPRYVKDRNRITGGGISSALDEALYIVELLLGTSVALKVQSSMQYYPDPPVSGSITPATTCPVPDLVS